MGDSRADATKGTAVHRERLTGFYPTPAFPGPIPISVHLWLPFFFPIDFQCLIKGEFPACKEFAFDWKTIERATGQPGGGGKKR
jgi:hypothetical protein